MGTFIGSLTNAASITLTNPIITHSFFIHTMPLTHIDISSTAVTYVAHSKLFSISFCNNRGLSSNLNSVHQYLQSSNSHVLFLTETRIKPLDPNDNSILCPHLKCPGYELFSSFFPNGGVCAYVHTDVQSSHLPQFDLVNPGFQLIWVKITLPNTSKFICTLYRSPLSTNHELLLDHLSKTIDIITLQSPGSEITILGDFNIYNPNWLTHSPHITSPAGRDAKAFAIVNDLSQLISEPTRIPDRSGDKANTLDLFLTYNRDIYSNPILDSPLGNSDHCLITLQHNFVSHQDRSSSSQQVFHYSKADWDSLRNFFAAYPWYSGLSNDPSSFATFITNAIQLGMDLLIPSSYYPGKMSSLKWFNSQCARAVKHKNHRFKQWKLHQAPHSRALFVQARNLCSKTIHHAKTSFVKRINNKIASCQTESRSFWFLATVVSQNFWHSSFLPLKNNSGSPSFSPSSKVNFFPSTLLPIPLLITKNSKILSNPHPPSQCPLLSYLHAKPGKSFSSSTPRNLVDVMV